MRLHHRFVGIVVAALAFAFSACSSEVSGGNPVSPSPSGQATPPVQLESYAPAEDMVLRTGSEFKIAYTVTVNPGTAVVSGLLLTRDDGAEWVPICPPDTRSGRSEFSGIVNGARDNGMYLFGAGHTIRASLIAIVTTPEIAFSGRGCLLFVSRADGGYRILWEKIDFKTDVDGLSWSIMP